jgi:hypothetical protein
MGSSSGRVITHFGPEHQALTLAERAERDAEEYRQWQEREAARTSLLMARTSGNTTTPLR